MKTKKSIAKRFKVTKKKVIAKKAGCDHFNAKESSKITRKKRKKYQFSKSFSKIVLKHL
jgi:ribosomal protein L35